MRNTIAGVMVLTIVVVACTSQVASATIIDEVHRHGGSTNEAPQIARNPLGEDVLCYVDRTHEYNAVPEGILGLAYVKVANNDKTTEDYLLEIMLSQDATLHLLLDNRLGYGDTPGGDPNVPPDLDSAGMHWVTEMGFTDTGMDVGIDESGDGDIDQWSSVYALDVSAGTTKLFQQSDLTNPGDRNMYAVAVAMSPSFLITGDGWAAALDSGTVRGMTAREWEESMSVLDPRGGVTFFPPDLYYSSGPAEPGQPDEPGMVMAWGTPEHVSAGPTASAWTYSYPLDPDLADSYIVATVFPPLGITEVSLMLTDDSGYSAAWKWGVGDKWSGKPLLEGVWNLVVLNMNAVIYGAGAAYPDKVTYVPQLLGKFVDKTKVAKIAFSEVYNGSTLSGPSVTPPGGLLKIAWNSWRELYVTKDPQIAPSTSGYVVLSQTPHYTTGTACFWGWDAISAFNPHHPAPAVLQQLPADDFECINYSMDLEVVRIRWWGSFEGWTGATPPSDPWDMPDEFVISIWTTGSSGGWDHPQKKTEWEYSCHPTPMYKGWERDPHSTSKNVPVIGDSCFEFSCDIPPDERWKRPGGPPETHWLSIQAKYNDLSPPSHPWGWKTRPQFGSDPSAVYITAVEKGGLSIWPPEVDVKWQAGNRIAHPQTISWNLAFELIGELKP